MSIANTSFPHLPERFGNLALQSVVALPSSGLTLEVTVGFPCLQNSNPMAECHIGFPFSGPSFWPDHFLPDPWEKIHPPAFLLFLFRPLISSVLTGI